VFRKEQQEMIMIMSYHLCCIFRRSVVRTLAWRPDNLTSVVWFSFASSWRCWNGTLK
jgi:hypothetical protein